MSQHQLLIQISYISIYLIILSKAYVLQNFYTILIYALKFVSETTKKKEFGTIFLIIKYIEE